MNWMGVMPAITTPFTENDQVDHEFLAAHSKWLLENGCSGLICLGSLGEGATLSYDEKCAVLRTVKAAADGKAPVIASIAGLSTSEAVQLAKAAADIGCDGLMVLPPYVYLGDWPEMKAHVKAVVDATSLPCMLYNNPLAYGTDFKPEQIAELANECKNVQAVKESSGNVRRVTGIRAATDDRLAIFVGVDDCIVESIGVGAVGWVAGLVNAFPRESVDLFEYASKGEKQKAFELYRWFLPLLYLDTVPKFIQLIKLVQEEVGAGSARVRAPRKELTGEELAAVRKLIRDSLKKRPKNASTPFGKAARTGESR